MNRKSKRVEAALHRATTGVFASLLDNRLVSPEVARVVVSLSNTNVSEEAVYASIAETLQGQFAPVIGSFRPVANGKQPTFVGFVAASRQMIGENDPRFKSLRPLTAGIMLDPEDDTVWNLHKGEAGTFVLREGAEDMGKVLETAKVRQTNAPKLSEIASAAQAGDYISFVDAKAGCLRHGFVVASFEDDTLSVITAEDEDMTTIDDEQVVDAVAFDEEDEKELQEVSRVVKANFDSNLLSQAEYYKQLYAFAPDYLEKVKAIIDGNASF